MKPSCTSPVSEDFRSSGELDGRGGMFSIVDTAFDTGLRLIWLLLAGVCGSCGKRCTFGDSGSGIISGTNSNSSSASGLYIAETGDMAETGETGDTGEMSSGLYREDIKGGAELISSSRSTDTGERLLRDLGGRSGDLCRLALKAVS